MAYLNPRYNGRVGVYRTNEIERFGSIPANVFIPGALGGIVFIPFNKGLTAAPASTANVNRYTYPLVQTYDNQVGNINFSAGVPRNNGISINDVNHDIFDFASIYPTINILSWRASFGVYEYTGTSPFPLYKTGGLTYSGIELINPIGTSPASGRQIMSFVVSATSSFTFAQYVADPPSAVQAKAFFYNFTDSENLDYVGSYSTTGIVFYNYLNQIVY
jgi:hypothetical protein